MDINDKLREFQIMLAKKEDIHGGDNNPTAQGYVYLLNEFVEMFKDE